MKNRKIAALILSVMMVMCSMPSFVFAQENAPAEMQGAPAVAEEAPADEAAAADEAVGSDDAQEKSAKAKDPQETVKEESGEKVKAESIDGAGKEGEEKAEPEEKKPAFSDSKTVGGVKVTVSAEEGAFPEGAKLVVSDVNASEEKKVDSAVDKVRDGDANVALSYVFDIHVEDKDGKEIQPADGRDVKVSFETEEVADSNLATDVYHVTDKGGSLKAEALDVKTDGDTASAGTDGFSYYTVEFTYGDLQYSMEGDTEVALSTILEKIGLTGTVTKAVSSNPDLFSVENNGSDWTVKALQAFCSEETLSLTIDGIDYVVKVTDIQHDHPSGSHGESGAWTKWTSNSSLPTASGNYYLNTDVTLARSQIPSSGTATIKLCLNGRKITISKGNNGLYDTNSSKNVNLTIYDSDDNSGIITNTSTYGAVIRVKAGSTYTLAGGKITNCNCSSWNAPVYLEAGTFTMKGGMICNNTLTDYAPVYVTSGTFNMSGGTITGNTNKSASGIVASGVHVIGGTFNMSGGSITNNNSPDANSAAGVYFQNSGLFNVKGKVTITGNTSKGKDLNVFVSGNKTIGINGNLDSDSRIGVTTATAPSGSTTIQFTNGLSGKGSKTNFISDNADYAVMIKNNEAHLIAHKHEFTYSVDDANPDTITATCVNMVTDCPLEDRKATLKIVAPALKVYGGSESERATLEGEIPGVTPPAIVYKKGNETLSAAPTNAGTYRAQVTLTGSDSKPATAYVDYTIAKADIKPVVNIDDWNYGQPANAPSVTEASNPGRGTVTYEYYTDEACTQKTTSAQGATEEGGAPSYGGDYWVKATVEETANYNSGTGTKGFKINATSVKVTGLKFVSKEYDGNTTATLDISEAELVGVDQSEDVHIASATGKFADKNVGPEKTIDGIVIVLSGSKAGGYKATADPATLTGAITAKPVTVSGITASNKTYDGNTRATLTFTGASLDGKISGDDLSVKGGTSQDGTFDNENVGTGKTVDLPALALAGNDAVNYKLAESGQQKTATADITAKEVTVSGIAAKDKTYDGNTDAMLDYRNVTLGGLVDGDELSVTATGTFENKNAGENKTVNISDLTLEGAAKGNYALAGSGQQTDTKARITAKEVGLEWTGTKLTYNGKDQKPKATATGLVGKDECTVTVSGEKKDSNVKSGEDSYTAKAESLSNTNYKLPENKTTSFTIGQKEIKVNGIRFLGKVYDGKTAATHLYYQEATLTGKVDGDEHCDDKLGVTATGTFRDPAAGTDKTIDLSDLTLTGTEKDNYKLAASGQQKTTTGNITKYSVDVQAESKTKEYGKADPELTYTHGAIIEGDSIVGELSRYEGEDVGEYMITVGTLHDKNKNYAINYTSAKLTITQAKTNNVTASIEGWTYGDDPKAPSATADFGVDTAVFTYSDSEDGEYKPEVPATAGKWYVKATVPGTKNYVEGVSKPVEFTIAQKEVGLDWSDTEFTYNGKAQKPKAAATGLEDGDKCEVTVDGEQTDANTKTGTDNYTATAASLSNSNYKLPEDKTQTFTIAPKELAQSMISLDSDTFKHDGTVKGPQVTMTDKDITESGQPKQMVKDVDYTLSGDSSSELGTHVITAEGQGNYTGSIETSWMMYSKKSNEQKEEGTGGRGDFEVFVDIENNSSTLTVDNLTIDLAKGFLTEEDMARYMEGEAVLVYMIVKEQPKSEAGAGDRYILGQLFREEGATDIDWYEITVWKKIGKSAAAQVHDTVEELSMSIEVPDGQKNAPEGYTREFYLGRSHDGASKLLAHTSKVKVGFGSSKFSTYALAYKDTKKPVDPDDPDNGGSGSGSGNGGSGSSKGGSKTGDPNDIAGLLALMLASAGALGAMGYRRRRSSGR